MNVSIEAERMMRIIAIVATIQDRDIRHLLIKTLMEHDERLTKTIENLT